MGVVVRWSVPAREGEQMPMHSNGQDWLVSWHRADDAPAGKPHGAAGVCLGPEGELVQISPDGRSSGFPAGRPEGEETIEETLRREMREEACVEVLAPRLLGYSRGECVQGHELGLVLVRSFWRADVRIDALGAGVRDRASADRSGRESHALRPRRGRFRHADILSRPGRGRRRPSRTIRLLRR